MDKATREENFKETDRIAKEIIAASARAKREKSERLLKARLAQKADAVRKPFKLLVDRTENHDNLRNIFALFILASYARQARLITATQGLMILGQGLRRNGPWPEPGNQLRISKFRKRTTSGAYSTRCAAAPRLLTKSYSGPAVLPGRRVFCENLCPKICQNVGLGRSSLS